MTDLKLSADIKEFLSRQTTADFIQAARQFVSLLETSNIEMTEFLKKSHLALVEVYSAGHRLDEIPLNYSSADSDFDDEKLFNGKNAQLISELGGDAFYWEIYDPTYKEKEDGKPESDWTISDKEPSQGWLVDDFSDIYRDLKIGLNKIDTIGTDEAVEDALWQLKWSFLNHWGLHCINAMRYLHYFCYDGKHVM